MHNRRVGSGFAVRSRVAIHPAFAGTVPFLGLDPGVPLSLLFCPGIFYSKFAFVNTVR